MSDDAHPEPLGDAGAVQADAARADHAQGLAVQLETLQARVEEEALFLVYMYYLTISGPRSGQRDRVRA